MAKTPTAAATTYEPDATYKVVLKRALPFGSLLLRPQDDVTLKGKHVAQLKAEDIESATKID